MNDSTLALLGALKQLPGADACGISTPLKSVSVVRFSAPTSFAHEIYTPVLCLVLQGAKEIVADGRAHAIASGHGLVVSIEVPVLSRVVEASHNRPYLAIAVDLDMALLDELAGEVASSPSPPAPAPRGAVLALGPTQERLLDCMKRLIDLTGRPEAEKVLGPGVVRELHYLLLSGPLGTLLRPMARPQSHLRRIARATSLLRQRFHEPLAVQVLADAAGMSTSSFHQHFKAITSFSPRQFQKQLRLMEARRLMQSEGATARRAAFAVGYESAQQFTREYAHRFGATPRQSIRWQAGGST